MQKRFAIVFEWWARLAGGMGLALVLAGVIGCTTTRVETSTPASEAQVARVTNAIPIIETGEPVPFEPRPLAPPVPAPAYASAQDNQPPSLDFLTFKLDSPVQFLGPKPNEIVIRKFTISGIIVGPLKTGRPLQLLNPNAPPEFGTMEDNTMPDLSNDRIIATKIFSWKF